LRGSVFSAALEFNYLKAPIGFLAIFVAPALLIGIAPSLVVACGHLLLAAPAILGGGAIVASVAFLILAALALWIGRPFLALALENLWHLHYSLVLPIFVVLREMLRGGRRKTRRQID
jgi:hypothetical protein